MFRLIVFSFFFCFAALFFQGSVIHGNFPGAVLPDLVLVYVVYLALRFHNLSALFVAFLLGLLVDVLSARLLGPFAASYVLAYLAVYILVGRLFAKKLLVFAAIVFLASLFKSSMYLSIVYLYQIQHLSSSFIVMFLEALYTALLSPIVLSFFSFLFPEKFSISKRAI